MCTMPNTPLLAERSRSKLAQLVFSDFAVACLGFGRLWLDACQCFGTDRFEFRIGKPLLIVKLAAGPDDC